MEKMLVVPQFSFSTLLPLVRESQISAEYIAIQIFQAPLHLDVNTKFWAMRCEKK